MGEVYRAHDSRLRRDVALKVLRPSLATPEYVQRLSREARATGSLNHPNILAVFDVGTEGAVPYVVSELLEGESLRQRLDRGPIPFRKSVEYGIQIAHALAAAHEKGICHRDVKPGNVFITTDARVKLLDFGLAKLRRAEAPDDMDDSTATQATRPVVIRGTAGYMAPEQILGEPVDPRTDIFALGAVLYEMFTGRRAFHRPTTAETQDAVLSEDPADPLTLNPSLPVVAVATVRRCLEKNKEERFQSARDLAFHLQQVEHSATSTGPHWMRRRAVRRNLLLLGVILAAMAVTGLLVWMLKPPTPMAFRQLTFHRGRIGGARFSPDGVVYSQAAEGTPLQVWRTWPESLESRTLEYERADVLAARGGELALATARRFVGGERFVGTLAVMPIGGTPAEKVKNVEDADWNPATGEFALARTLGMGEHSWLEYPAGYTLYETPGSGSILYPRISRDGQSVAFLEDPAGVGAKGRVVVVNRAKQSRILTDVWANARGLAWSPRGNEIWYTAGESGTNRALRAVDLERHHRLVYDSPASLTIWDAAPDGRVLITRDDERRALIGLPPGEGSEVDLSWFDSPGLASISIDGRYVLFGDRFGGVYVRDTRRMPDGSRPPPMKLESKAAYPDDISPDGSAVLATSSEGGELFLLPTGAPNEGTTAARFAPAARLLHVPGLSSYSGSRWFPDGRRILCNGLAPGHRLRAYIVDLDHPDAPPRPLTEDGIWALSLSLDGTQAAASGHGLGVSVWPTDGGPSRTVPGSEAEERAVAWSRDGASIWVFKRDQIPIHIDRVEIATGRRQLWKTLAPPDAAGVYSINELQITPDGKSYFYTYRRVLSELYLASGLK